ncbi:MAG: hypothetical protein QME12_03950, partial [Nanoarchaeota archaeon]|nr:hypothetical protein [Nanoarchaeota archaeon]
MDYIETFLECPEPHKLSMLEQIAFTAGLARQVERELLNPGFEPRLSRKYYPEEHLVKWMDFASSTLPYRFFNEYFSLGFHNEENIPQETGALLVANHSTLFLADVAAISFGLHRKKRRFPYGLAFEMLGRSDI